ncbi:MAG TPA: Rsd/AlgQ family anti-sigma factor [Pseudomonadales bacterium]
METVAHYRRPAAADRYVAEADRSFIACRQKLISYLVKLNDALDARLPDLSQALLRRFCDALVDYLSAGHFRVFQRVSLPAGTYALIEATTEAGMTFNDRFGGARRVVIDEVRGALEVLARALSERFELEDELLGAP